MRIRVVSPKVILFIYLGTELLAIPFFILILFGIGPYQYMNEMPDLRLLLLLFLSVSIVLPLYFEFFSFGSLRLKIDEYGVTYHSRQEEYHLPWSEVKRIALIPDAFGEYATTPYVCFFADEEPRTIKARAEFNPRAFGVQNRKGLPEMIAKFCDIEIENLNVIDKKR